jgi:hypothetical protein
MFEALGIIGIHPMPGKVEAGPVLVMLVAEGVAWCKLR